MAKYTKNLKIFGFALILFISTLILIWGIIAPTKFVRDLENRSWDWRLQAAAKQLRADQSVKIIAIDQKSLDFFESEYALTWPLPRDIYVPIIQFLESAGAKGVAFDLIFSESSAQAVEADQAFATASGGHFPVVNSVAFETYGKYLAMEKFKLFSARQQKIDLQTNFSKLYQLRKNLTYQSATLPIPELIEKSVALGCVQVAPDQDGVFRRYRPGSFLRTVPALGLPFAFYHTVMGAEQNLLWTKAINSDGTLIIRPAAQNYETIPFAAVVQAQVSISEGKKPLLDPGIFKNAWVFVGALAPGLFDVVPTSLNERGKGVQFNAVVLDNLLNNNFVRIVSPAWSIALGVIFILATLLIIFYIRDLRIQTLLLCGVFLIFCYLATDLVSKNYWLLVVPQSLALIFATVAGFAYQFQLEGKQRRFLRTAFKFYVSPAVVDEIIENSKTLALGGERRELTLFFSDIAGFTNISENVPAESLAKMLNLYLSAMTDIILQFGGTLDKYVGDGITAFWNAPITVPDHATKAVECAIACQLMLKTLNATIKETYGVELLTRIGIHTDFVAVGNFGSDIRFNYTIVGDGANLTSRIEGTNKVFGTNTLLTAKTKDLLPQELLCRKVAVVKVIGKEELITVFEPRINSGDPCFSASHLEAFNKARNYFENGDSINAEIIFKSLTIDPVAVSYLKRIKEEGNTVRDPIWKLKEK